MKLDKTNPEGIHAHIIGYWNDIFTNEKCLDVDYSCEYSNSMRPVKLSIKTEKRIVDFGEFPSPGLTVIAVRRIIREFKQTQFMINNG